MIRNRLLGILIAVGGSVGGMAAVATASASAAGLTGAGSTLVAPLMANWINGFEIKEGIPVKYGAVGSGAGIAQITARTVDFGASDAPLTPRTGSRLQRLRPDSLGAVGHRPRLQRPGRQETEPDRARSSPGSTSARSPTGTTRRSSQAQPEGASCRTWRSPRSSAATAPVTPTRSPTTSRRSARPGRTEVGYATTVGFKAGVGAKGNSGVTSTVDQDPGRDRLHLRLLPDRRRPRRRRGREQGRQLRVPEPEKHRKRRLDGEERAGRATTISITNPPKKATTAYPISTFTYAIVPHNAAAEGRSCSSSSTTTSPRVRTTVPRSTSRRCRRSSSAPRKARSPRSRADSAARRRSSQPARGLRASCRFFLMAARRLGEGLGGAAAEVGVEHPGDLARAFRRPRGRRRRSGRWRGSRRAGRRSRARGSCGPAAPRRGCRRRGRRGRSRSGRGRRGRARAARRRARWRGRGRGSRRGAGPGRAPGCGPPRRPGRWLESSSRIPAGREAAEARRRAPCSQPVAQREANSSSASRSGSAASWSTAGSSSSSTVRSSGRSARLSSIARSAAASSKLSKAASRLSSLAGAAWRWRASAIAEEMLPVWASASRRVCSSISS